MSDVISHGEHKRALNPDNARGVRGWSIFLILVITAAFMALAFAAHTTPYFGFDLTITRAIQFIRVPWFGDSLNLIALPGYPPQVYVVMTALILVLWFKGARWEAVGVLFANLVVGTLGTGIKLVVARMRPSPDLVHVANPSLDGGGLSFPAGHVLVYVTVLGFLMYLLLRTVPRKWWQSALLILMAVFILLIGVARIYSGEHWFSDVVGGYLFGAIGLWLTIYFYEWSKHRFSANDPRGTPKQTT